MLFQVAVVAVAALLGAYAGSCAAAGCSSGCAARTFDSHASGNGTTGEVTVVGDVAAVAGALSSKSLAVGLVTSEEATYLHVWLLAWHGRPLLLSGLHLLLGMLLLLLLDIVFIGFGLLVLLQLLLVSLPVLLGSLHVFLLLLWRQLSPLLGHDLHDVCKPCTWICRPHLLSSLVKEADISFDQNEH